MMALVGAVVFAGTFGVSVYVVMAAIGPQWRRIGRLAMGHVEPTFAPLHTLAIAERRIAVRHWSAASPVPAPLQRLRAVA